MAYRYAALVKTVTATSAFNDYVLSIANNTGPYRTPKQAVADGSLLDGDTVLYECRDTTVLGDALFEIGEGVYTDATNTVSRQSADVIEGSDGPGVLVEWGFTGQRDFVLLNISGDLRRLARTDIFTTMEEGLIVNNSQNVSVNPFTVHGATGDSPPSLVVNNVGHVGIGRSSPVSPLDVLGDALIRGALDSRDTTVFNITVNDLAVGTNFLLVKGVANPFLLSVKPSNDTVGVGVDTGDGSSILDVTSTSRGFLPPRMTTVQSDAIGTPAEGLTVFDTTAKLTRVFRGAEGWRYPGIDPAEALVFIDSNVAVTIIVPLVIDWDVEEKDTDDVFDPGSPSELVVPTGFNRAQIQAQVTWAASPTGDLTQNQTILKNGGTGYVGRPSNTHFTKSGTIAQIISPVLTVVPGDIFELEVLSDSSRNAEGSAAGDKTWMYARFWAE